MTSMIETAAPSPRATRVVSLDVVRGAVMVLMAIDHVRVYSGVPAGGPTPGVFFTRWVTHFCAPTFVFLAGTSAFLHGRKLGDPYRLAKYLVARGVVLVLLELTVIRVAWTFNGDPRAWNGVFGLGFLNTTKYPASLQFLLMTLGPIIALLPLASLRSPASLRAAGWQVERTRAAFMEMLAVFGRVPLFYYLLRIPAIHAAALVVSLVREGRVNAWLFENHPMLNPPPPQGYTWSLSLLYLVFVIVVAALYVPCRWFAGLKARHRDGLLQYL